MANGNLAACLDITLKHEGGWADHPKDPGGATMKGVTLATYRRYFPGATKAQLRAISDANLQRIYRDGFWNPINGELLPWGLDLAVFDYGVNSGPSRAAKALQAIVGVPQDGKVGAKTLAAVMGVKTTIQKLCAKRLGFVQGLKTWSAFGKGWARRIADIEARAVAMWLSHAGRQSVPSDLQDEAIKADGRAKQNDKAAAGAGPVGAGGAGAVGIGSDWNWWLIGGGLVLVLVVVALLARKAMQDRERAAAYRAVAAETGLFGK
jgi:lysozyme family protein